MPDRPLQSVIYHLRRAVAREESGDVTDAQLLDAFVSRRDFSAWGSFLIVGLWVLIGTMFLNFFFQNAAVGLWLASVAVLLFSGLLVFDTWRLRNFYGPDEYVGAAVQIYLDLLNMFMAILRLTGNRRN